MFTKFITMFCFLCITFYIDCIFTMYVLICQWGSQGRGCRWIYNYLCNQCLSQISIRAMCTTLCDKVCQWLATGRWFSPGPSVSSTNKTDRHNITELLFKVLLNTIKQTNLREDWLLTNCVTLYIKKNVS